MEFTGIIQDGFGKGAHYIVLPGYKNQFIEKLNLQPYPGTLNIKVDIEIVKSILEAVEPIIINGFEVKEKRFGALKCYKCLINELEGWIIIIEKSTHNESIIEIISEKRIRNYYNGEVTITLK